MKKVILFLVLSQISLVNFGQIIADHTIVDKFDDIPQYYIDQVKKMFVTVPGESHSQAYRTGLLSLETSYPTYAVSVVESGTPEAYTTTNLRFSRATWGDYSNSSGWIYNYGEEDWWTNTTAINRTKAGITYCNTHNLNLAAIGFGWCWDMVNYSTAATADPVYGVHWRGTSIGGPSGELPWGLDAADNTLTGNSVNMDTYLSATQNYIDYCTANGYSTKVFFTTGPVDTYFTGESGYQGHLKHEYIRNYVLADPTRILFDYADILCYDDNGTPTTTTWSGHTYPTITTTNLGAANVGHIGSAGSIRLAKAIWWMLARMAGWDGGTTTVPVTSITVTGAGGATTISTTGGTLQLSAAVLPANASNKTVTWTVANGTGQATINSTGLVTAVADGTVTARATANDGSGVYSTLVITISNQVIPVAAITATTPNGGENWPVGSSRVITWTSSGTSGNVHIEYSTNNGTSWTDVIASTPDDGTHSWTIPNATSTNCLVRVSDTDGNPVDVSNAVFSIIPVTSGTCINETFTAATGTVTDNSGSLNYLNNMACEKLIQPSVGGKITLTFTTFNTEGNYDYVRVYDGSTTSATLLGTFSGTSLPPILTSSSGSMLIRFTTDGYTVSAGWSATYTCTMSVGAKGTEEISEQEILNVTKLVAYPNPTSGILTIESTFTEEETYTIYLINASGQVILNQRINVIGGKFDIDISNISPGSYLLKIMTNRTGQFIRVIKQ
jgi:hypothetical protein